MDRLKEIEARKAEIKKELKNLTDKEKLEALNTETDALNREVEEIKALEQRKEIARKLENKSLVATDITKEVKRTSESQTEIRNSKEYIDAYAEYLKTGDATTVRSLLTTNTSDGTIAVPDMVADLIKTSREKNEIMSLVPSVELPANYSQMFEIVGTAANDHKEGEEDGTDGEIEMGTVKLIPGFAIKDVTVSKEALSLKGAAFLEYIYGELLYKIDKKVADRLVEVIKELPGSATTTSPGAEKISAAPGLTTISKGKNHTCDEATNHVVIMNKLTADNFDDIAASANYAQDIYKNCSVKYSSTLPAYDAANEGDVYLIVGDLNYGTLANYPNGKSSVEFSIDKITKKKKGMVVVTAEEYVAVAVVADKAFTLITKPAAQASEQSAEGNKKNAGDTNTTSQTPVATK